VKLGLLIQFVCTFSGGLVYAFYASWRITFVVLCTVSMENEPHPSIGNNVSSSYQEKHLQFLDPTAQVPFLAISGWFLVSMTTTTTKRANEAYAEAGSVVYTTVTSIRTLLSLNAVPTMVDKFTAATEKAYEDATRRAGWLGVANGCMMASFLLSSIVVPLYGGKLLWDQIMDSGCDPSGSIPTNEPCEPSGKSIFGAMFAIFMSASAIPQISTILQSFTQSRSACFLAQQVINRRVNRDEDAANTSSPQERVDTNHEKQGHPEATTKSIDEEEPDTMMRRGGGKLPEYRIDSSSPYGIKPTKLEGNIVFKNVTFAYPTRQEIKVLRGFNLNLKAGQSVGIVGKSGSGKSTIVQLLERNYDPQEGSVTIDDYNLKDLNVKWLRQQIGLVWQEPKLFGALSC
jgi:ATP-binding cassette, subfamily B (MDR/TAP), member 1